MGRSTYRPADTRQALQHYDNFLHTSPVLILSLFTLILSYALTIHPPTLAPTSRAKSLPNPTTPETSLSTPPSLHALLADIADALDAQKVTYWLQPGLGLLPVSTTSFHGKLSPWQHGVDLAVPHTDLMRVILAQTELQTHGILSVESYFGLRLFPLSGHYDDRYDFRTPFIDILYIKYDDIYTISHCCDCEPVKISACTKKTCGCLVCATNVEDVFPLVKVSIKGVRRPVPGPNNVNLLMLPRNIEGIHEAVFDL